MKRSLILLLILAMVCTLGVPAIAEDPFQPGIYGKEVQILTDLGITTLNVDGAINDTAVTRAELVVLVVKAMGYSDVANGTYTEKFTDVPSSYWAFPYIMFAVQAGLFQGTSATTFEPDGPVEASEAICSMVNMINCTRLAEARGGYPVGYWTMAAERKLLNNTNLQMNTNISRDQLYILLYNTIQADMLVYDGVGDGLKFSIQEGRTILTENHGIYYVEGIITADNETAFTGAPATKAGSFRMGDMTFTSSTGLGQGKVGRKVTVYYKDPNMDYFEAVALYEEDNVEVTLTPSSITNFDYANGVYEVEDGSKQTKFRIGKDYYLVYNGEAIDGSDQTLMLPESGHITLIDNNGDGIYDVVFVYEYYNLIFGRYDQYTNELKDKLGDTEKNVDLDQYETITTNVEDFSSLADPSILTVYKSRGGTSVRILHCAQMVQGEVSAVYEDSTMVYTINGNDYRASSAPRYQTDGVSVGQRYTFYLDTYGTVAYTELSVAQSGAYVVKFGSKGGLGNYQVQMFTTGGELEVYDLAQRVSIVRPGGTSTVTAQEVAGIFESQEGSKRLFVLYQLNEEKQVREIVMPQIITTEEEFESKSGYLLYKMDYYVENWPNTGSSAYRQYKTRNMGFGNWLILGEGTTVLTVPAEAETSFNEDNFSASSVSGTFTQDETITVTPGNSGNKGDNEIDVYKLGDSGYEPEILIRYGAAAQKSVTDDKEFAVIKDVRQVYDEEEGSAAWQITYIESGNEQTAVLNDNGLNTREGIESSIYSSSIGNPQLAEGKDSYKPGDIIKYSKNTAGKITNMCLLYDGINQQLTYSGLEAFGRIFRMTAGEVEVIDGNYLEMRIASTGIVERSRITSCRVVVMDVKNEKVTTGSVADIAVEDEVVIYSRYSENRTIMVYKNR